MTYKSIVEDFLRKDSAQWVWDLIKENGIEYLWLDEEVEHIQKEKDQILYGVKVTVTLPDYKKAVLVVGGTVDDLIGISHSVIWSEGKEKIIWMAVEKTRERLGITEFKMPYAI